ncbi:ABC transporter ATP-binding protein [Paenibacillus sp. 2TAB26]|uniref:ABC transporter ATP-binding protein n=1 Tax=Paenibacillus sp. 2TAB26 TaxID=3233005 RepID=UPI003F9E5142
MLSDETVLKIKDISKSYKMYDSPAARLLDFFDKKGAGRFEEFHALDSISFEVKRGDTVGIVGKNGSGKSTLLQILAGTVTPTSGSIETVGKVVALLELGSGFNPEFSGRENVYLNAAIYGISREAIQNKFSEIEKFADIGDHIDQPVKTYSSGMFARLAFSVAINMEPDILIIDEILAVGDVAFQAKCVSKMRQLKEKGVTLLFVSHSVDSIKSMCNSAILLKKGKMIEQGTAERITNRYLAMVREEMNENVEDTKPLNNEHFVEETNALKVSDTSAFKYGTGEIRFLSAYMSNEKNELTKVYEFGEQATLVCEITSDIVAENINVSFLVRDITGVDLFGTTMFDENVTLISVIPKEKKQIRFKFPVSLRQGSYSISVAVNEVTNRDYSDTYLYEQIDGITAFEVIRKLDRPVHYKVYIPIEIKL